VNGTIDVFDENFQLVRHSGAFEDKSLPSDAVPFNVQRIGDRLFVTYAIEDKSTYDYVFGVGRGYVDEYDLDGNLIQNFAVQGELNVPWGVALAPESFGQFGGALLVGNFGDGHVNAFDAKTGAFLGQLTDDQGNSIAIPGLWGLTFGNDHLGGSAEDLFFTAGIDFGNHGLFGAIQSPARRGRGHRRPVPVRPEFPRRTQRLSDPPTNGPALSAPATPQVTAVLLPVATSSLVFAPTLTTTFVARGRDADAATVPAFAADSRVFATIAFASYTPFGNLTDESVVFAGPAARDARPPASFLDLAPSLAAPQTITLRPTRNPVPVAPLIVDQAVVATIASHISESVAATETIPTQTVALAPLVEPPTQGQHEPERRSWFGFAILFIGTLGSLAAARELHGRRIISLSKLRTPRSAPA